MPRLVGAFVFLTGGTKKGPFSPSMPSSDERPWPPCWAALSDQSSQGHSGAWRRHRPCVVAQTVPSPYEIAFWTITNDAKPMMHPLAKTSSQGAKAAFDLQVAKIQDRYGVMTWLQRNLQIDLVQTSVWDSWSNGVSRTWANRWRFKRLSCKE